MNSRNAFIMLVLIVAVAFAGCSDSSSPTDEGKTDTTPPAIASVTALDAQHIDVEFDEALDRTTAERRDNYTIVEVAPVLAYGTSPGDTVHVGTAALDEDGLTVHIATENTMQDVPYELRVLDVKDKSGNAISTQATQAFTGSNTADTTPPTIVSRTPSPGQTGVGVGQSVTVQFSEPMNNGSVYNAFSWTGGGGSVPWSMDQQDNNTFLFTPSLALQTGTTYTIMISATAEDWSGNALSPVSWNFTTTSQTDTTPPRLVSSTPSNGATNVSVSTNLQLTFSEAVEPSSLDQVIITPDVGGGVESWSNGGRTVTFDPDVDLASDTQYSMLLFPGSFRDLAGNGNEESFTITWTTGSALATGGFSGTIGGPGSADAPGPGGAFVIAADRNPFGPDDDFGVGGTGAVAANGSYTVGNVPAGTWWPLGALDSNGDDIIDPGLGDAFGLYGVDFAAMTGEADTVVVSTSVVTGIDFDLFDSSAIAGTVTYTGSAFTGGYTLYVGAFDTTGFDPNNIPQPDYGTAAYWPDDPSYAVSTFENGLMDGTYYVGAFLDGNDNGSLDPGEPSNLYGGAMTPTPLTIENGSDALGVDIELADPPAFTGTVQWTATPDRGRHVLERIGRAFRAAQKR